MFWFPCLHAHTIKTIVFTCFVRFTFIAAEAVFNFQISNTTCFLINMSFRQKPMAIGFYQNLCSKGSICHLFLV